MTILQAKSIFERAKGAKAQLQKDLKETEMRKKAKSSYLELLEQAQVFLQKVAQATQEKLKFQVEDVVNLALDTCFPNEYEFKIDFEILRGKTEAKLVFLSKKTNKEIDPMTASGGGVVDLTSFALRIACYALEKNIDNVIILDEPFRFLSRDLQERAGSIIKILSERLDLQIILVTHIPELINYCDKVFQVSKKGAISNVKVIA